MTSLAQLTHPYNSGPAETLPLFGPEAISDPWLRCLISDTPDTPRAGRTLKSAETQPSTRDAHAFEYVQLDPYNSIVLFAPSIPAKMAADYRRDIDSGLVAPPSMIVTGAGIVQPMHVLADGIHANPDSDTRPQDFYDRIGRVYVRRYRATVPKAHRRTVAPLYMNAVIPSGAWNALTYARTRYRPSTHS